MPSVNASPHETNAGIPPDPWNSTIQVIYYFNLLLSAPVSSNVEEM
jgi:hypothetical protein